MINRLDYALGNGNRPYQYKVSIILPSGISTLLLDNDKVDALCKRATVPDMQMEQSSIFVHGREVKVPFSTTYSTESVIGFYLDDDYYMRGILEFWMLSMDAYRTFHESEFVDTLVPKSFMDKLKSVGTQLVNRAVKELKAFALLSASQFASNIGFSVVEDYLNKYMESLSKSKEPPYGEVHISPLTYNMEEICTYKLKNAYPINLSTVNYANDSVGSISEFDATFYYTHYTVERDKGLVGNFVSEAGDKVISGIRKITGL